MRTRTIPATKSSFWLLVAALVLCFVPAQANDEKIVLGTLTKGWPPFIIPAGGTPDCIGIMPDILKEICGTCNIAIDNLACSVKRHRQWLDQGKADVSPLSKKWVKNPNQYAWTAPVLSIDDVIVSRKEAPVEFTKITDLENLRIGVIHGYVYPTLDALFSSGIIHKQTAFNVRNLLLMLARNHVDGIVAPRHVAEWVIRNEPALDAATFAYSTTPVDSSPYAFAFTKAKDWAPFIARFNAELEKMRTDGRLDAILAKYR